MTAEILYFKQTLRCLDNGSFDDILSMWRESQRNQDFYFIRPALANGRNLEW